MRQGNVGWKRNLEKEARVKGMSERSEERVSIQGDGGPRDFPVSTGEWGKTRLKSHDK